MLEEQYTHTIDIKMVLIDKNKLDKDIVTGKRDTLFKIDNIPVVVKKIKELEGRHFISVSLSNNREYVGKEEFRDIAGKAHNFIKEKYGLTMQHVALGDK